MAHCTLRTSKIPKAMQEYAGFAGQHPIIKSAFSPDRGWKSLNMNKRITVAYARSLKREGYTHVSLVGGLVQRGADFTLDEIIRGGYR